MTKTSAGETLGLADPSLLREAVPIGGQWIEAGSDRVAVSNPATAELSAMFQSSGNARPRKQSPRHRQRSRAGRPSWQASAVAFCASCLI